MGKEPGVPVCISGSITAVHPSLCMDGATHIIHTPCFGSYRLLATNEEAKKALTDFEDAKVMVTVCGYPKNSVNCQHIEVFYVGLADDFAPKLEAIT